MEIVEIEVGDDAGAAQYLAEVCRDEGIRLQLVLGEDPYRSLSRSAAHRLVVELDDVPHIERIVRDHFPAMLSTPTESAETHEPTSSVKARRIRLLVGIPVLAFCLAAIVVVAIGALQLLI